MAKIEEKDELTTYYENIYKDIEEQTNKDPFGNYIFQRVSGGTKTVFNKTQTEIRNFDMSFLDTIESVYPAILKIMRDPKKSIRYEEEVVSVEKAKKVNSETVRHLSSHTQLIKEITKEGDVIPSKILTTYAEEELAIYENRFIKSLVKRMEMFLERRYEVMKVSLESFETQKFNVSNDFLLSGQKVTVNLDIQIKNDLTTNVQATKEQYNRLLYVRELVQGLKGTEFMRALAKARDVLPPIMKTNIIMHNPDFKLAYGLWLYLDKVDGISTNVDVKEKTYKYTDIFQRDINQCMALAVTSFIKNREVEGIYTSKNLPTLKAPKPISNEGIELEMNFNADNKKLEDYTMNQILLDETAKFFEASMSGIQRSGSTYNESIRVVYRQMLDMLDQIYPRTFGVSIDQLESKNLYEQLDFQRKKLMVLKIVQQQKQMNIARMGKDSKRVEKEITKLEGKIKVFEEKEREKELKRLQKEEAQRQAAIARAKALEEKRKRLEQEAIARQNAAEKKALERERKENAGMVDLKKAHQASRSLEAQMRRRERLRELKTGISLEDQLKEENRVLDGINDEDIYNTIETSNLVNEDDLLDNTEDNVDDLLDQIPTKEEKEADELLASIPEKNEEQPSDEIDSNNEAIESNLNAQDDIDDLNTELSNDEATSNNNIEDAKLAEESNDSDEEAFEEAINAIPEDNDEEEQIVYVDEDGNVIDNYEESSEFQQADEYEQMLKDSGMTDEEIQALLGIESKDDEVDEPEEQNVDNSNDESDTNSEDEEFMQALGDIPEGKETTENVGNSNDESDTNSEDEEFMQALGDIPEGKEAKENVDNSNNESDTNSEDEEFMQALGDIPEGKEAKENVDNSTEASNDKESENSSDDFDEDEFMRALGDIPDGKESVVDEAADDYEKMLKDSGMTDEEIANLLGDDK